MTPHEVEKLMEQLALAANSLHPDAQDHPTICALCGDARSAIQALLEQSKAALPQEQKALPPKALTEEDAEHLLDSWLDAVFRARERLKYWAEADAQKADLVRHITGNSSLSSPSAGRKEVLASGRAAEASVVQGTEQQPESPPTTSHDPFFKYRDPFNPGWVEFCGECGSPCVPVRPGKTQCESCDWWMFADTSPFVRAGAARCVCGHTLAQHGHMNYGCTDDCSCFEFVGEGPSERAVRGKDAP